MFSMDKYQFSTQYEHTEDQASEISLKTWEELK